MAIKEYQPKDIPTVQAVRWTGWATTMGQIKKMVDNPSVLSWPAQGILSVYVNRLKEDWVPVEIGWYVVKFQNGEIDVFPHDEFERKFTTFEKKVVEQTQTSIEQATLAAWAQSSTRFKKAMREYTKLRAEYLQTKKEQGDQFMSTYLRPDEEAELEFLLAMEANANAERVYLTSQNWQEDDSADPSQTD